MDSPAPHHVFITGASGFVGRNLIPALLARGHSVRALVRPGSARRIPPGPELLTGAPLDGSSYSSRVAPCDTFVHLVGIAHPSPFRPNQFRDVDLKSLEIALASALAAGVFHFIYLSVAQPVPFMGAYVRIRQQGEDLLRRSPLSATFVRPFYVLGPGRRWPLVLSPLFNLLESISATRPVARRLGFVTIDQMTGALVHAVEHPARGVRILEVPDIRLFHS
jgi:nucleoside-diphosphate-sugar epimerase